MLALLLRDDLSTKRRVNVEVRSDLATNFLSNVGDLLVRRCLDRFHILERRIRLNVLHPGAIWHQLDGALEDLGNFGVVRMGPNLEHSESVGPGHLVVGNACLALALEALPLTR